MPTESGMLTPQEIDALVAQKAQSPEMEAIMKAVLKRESSYGQKASAYKPNPAGGVIGIGQIQSKSIGGKHNNFEQYADAGETDIYNPVHTAKAALNMMADKWNKSGGSTQEFVNQYFGRAAKDKLGGTNAGYVAAMNNALVNGVSTPTGQSTFRGSSANSVANPTSRTAESQAYNAQMIDAAKKVAANNLSSVNAFDWNPNTENSAARNFAESVSGNTDNLTNLYNNNTKHMEAFTNPTADTYLGRVWDKLSAMWNVTGNALAEDYFRAQQAGQFETGKAMSEQVLNMQKPMQNTTVDPNVYNVAAGNVLQQQNADTNRFSAISGNEIARGNQAIAVEGLNMDKQKFELEKMKLAAQMQRDQQAATFQQNLNAQVATAAKALGITLPANASYQDAMTLITDPQQKALFSKAVISGGSLSNSLYDAVKLGQLAGASPQQQLVASKWGDWIQSILNTPENKEMLDGVTDPETGKHKGGITDPALREQKERMIVNGVLEKLSRGETGFNAATSSENPYSMVQRTSAFWDKVQLPSLLDGVSNDTSLLARPFAILRITGQAALDKGHSIDEAASQVAASYKQAATTIDDLGKAEHMPLPGYKPTLTLKSFGANTSEVKIDLTNPVHVKLAMTKLRVESQQSLGGAIKGGILETTSKLFGAGNEPFQIFNITPSPPNIGERK